MHFTFCFEEFDPDENLSSEESTTDSTGDHSMDRDGFDISASDMSEDDDPEGGGVLESITNNRAPLMTRFDDTTAPKVWSSLANQSNSYLALFY